MTSASDGHPDDTGDATTARSAPLAGLAASYWEAALAAAPTSATLLGVHDHDDRLEDLSETAEQQQLDVLRTLRDRLSDVRATLVSPEDLVTASLLEHQLGVGIRGIELRLVELASDHMLGPHAELLMAMPQLTYPEPEHADAALRRYEQVPALLEQAFERFRAGAAGGRTPAAAVLARTLNTLDGYLAGPVEADPFLGPSLPEQWSGAAGWRSAAEAIVRQRIRPAFQRYRDDLERTLVPVARDDEHAGWGWLPNGEDLYLATIEQHTTVRSSPAELHELGRRLCEHDLPVEFASLGPAAIGSDDLATIFGRLREDPELRHRDEAEVLRIARDSVARATAAMGSWFGRLPASPCRVEPIPDFLAADAPYAYYFPPATDGSRAGTYFINTADPTGSSRTEAQSIAFHEAIPGHHLQIAISQELDGLPDFQRHDGATSYIEGWGLYAERLADEMGLYSGPLDRIGMLTADAWRSARLVVDTGLHALGWSRQRAIDYFMEHTPVPADQVAPEVDRYLAMPGQALSYKVGQLEIERLRAEASDRLGARFDVAAFHDVVLGSGAVTLPVLGDLVEAWISRDGRR
jgi:uncharacterized protein (DUF885 family)